MQSATEEKVEAAAIPLRDYALFSQQLYLDWANYLNSIFLMNIKVYWKFFRHKK
jgi:hypothetical protein